MDEATHHRFLNSEVDKALDVLMEHYDALQIVGTYVDDRGQTVLLSRGRGNWYARRGAMSEVLDRELAETTAGAIGDVMMIDEGEDD